MLFTMDGGDSLKRVLSRGPAINPGDGSSAEALVGPTNEYTDPRMTGDSYYIAREKVDAWSHEALEKLAPMPQEESVSYF